LSLDKDNLTKYANKFLVHNDYCQSETFFEPYKEDIKRIFKPDIGKLSPQAQEWKVKIERTIAKGKVPVGIHVRRGDFGTSKQFNK